MRQIVFVLSLQQQSSHIDQSPKQLKYCAMSLLITIIIGLVLKMIRFEKIKFRLYYYYLRRTIATHTRTRQSWRDLIEKQKLSFKNALNGNWKKKKKKIPLQQRILINIALFMLSTYQIEQPHVFLIRYRLPRLSYKQFSRISH